MIIMTIIFFILEIITFPLIPLRVLIILKVRNETFIHIFLLTHPLSAIILIMFLINHIFIN